MPLLQLHSERPHHTINLNELRLSSAFRVTGDCHISSLLFSSLFFFTVSPEDILLEKQQRTRLFKKRKKVPLFYFGLKQLFSFKEQISLLVKCSFAFNLPNFQSWRTVKRKNRRIFYFYFLTASGM